MLRGLGELRGFQWANIYYKTSMFCHINLYKRGGAGVVMVDLGCSYCEHKLSGGKSPDTGGWFCYIPARPRNADGSPPLCDSDDRFNCDWDKKRLGLEVKTDGK